MIALLLLGCFEPSNAQPETPVSSQVQNTSTATPIMDCARTPPELALTWSLAREPEALTIQYELSNRGAERLWIAERLVQTSQGKATLLERPIVRTSGVPGTALVALAKLSPDVPVYYLPPPTYRAVEPGASASGTVRVGLPLTSWHPIAKVDPLGEVQAIQFALDGFFGEPASWKEGTDAEGRAFRTPVYRTLFPICTGARPLPPG